jgi:purine nucleosidase
MRISRKERSVKKASRLFFVLAAFGLAWLVIAAAPACAGTLSDKPASTSGRLKVIIDTDIGEDIDDILVTAFALASPEFEVLAITTVDGNVAARSRVARRVTQAFGRPEVPVAAGYVRSLPLLDTTYTGFSGGVRYGEVAPDESGLPPPCPLKADSLIAELAVRYPGEVTLLSIGSMTNVGQFLVRYPQAARKLRQIVTNGGNFRDPANQSIGWNLRYDPLAALIASRSGVPWVLLSETTSGPASPRREDVERLERAGLPSTELLVEAIRWWKKNKTDATALPHVSDLNVFAYLLGLVETEPGNVFFDLGSADKLPGFRVEPDPAGRIRFGSRIAQDKADCLRAIFFDRLTALPSGPAR